ncbi:MAG: M6 family metalloprotease domain-containing protein [Prevotella sp.]|nr:M6 family metalloprotease domain-containing protein [Prevotella sp.]
MKRIVLITLVLFSLVLKVEAIRPRHVAFSVAQSDGTQVMVYKNGDGHLAYYTTLDNHVVVKNEQGDLCYAILDSDGRLVAGNVMAHNEADRSAVEKTYVEMKALQPGNAIVQQKVQRRRAPKRPACYASTDDGLGKYRQSGMGAVNSIGEYTIPVIMVQFKDLKFQSSTTKAKMTRFYNEEGYSDETLCVGSVRDYFKSQSRGMFIPTFEIVGIVTLDKDYVKYGRNITSGEYKGYDVGLAEDNFFVIEAVKKAVEQGVDFNKYVVNGGVPLVSILYAGPGEATEDDGDDYIWPCEYDIEEDIEGVHFNSYFVGNELDYGDSLMGMGVFCHEFGHALGLPDFYCTDGNYTNDDAMSNWSIMDTGAYVNDSRSPIGYNAYERSYLGWLDIPELTEMGDVTLARYDDSTGNPAVLIRNSQKEYFILENRQPDIWYPDDMGSGLLLTRFAYDKTEWDENTLNNTQKKKRAMVITANGKKMYYSGSQEHLYGNLQKNITSLPLYSGSKLTTKPIYNITKNQDGTITFSYLVNTGGEIVEPTEDNVFVKVTSEDQITAGKHYILVNENAEKAAGELNGKYLEAVDIEINNGSIIIDDDEVEVFTLGGNGYVYSLQNTAGEYLITKEDRKLEYTATKSSIWGINYSMDAGGFVVESDDYGKIQYNKGVPRFMNYLSGSQSAAVLYVNDLSQGGGDSPVDPIDPSGGDVAGDGKFKRVISDSELESNRSYLIVYEDSETEGVAFSGVSNDIGCKVDVTIANGIIDNTKAGAAVVTLLDGDNGQWYMETSDGYLQYDKPIGTNKNNNIFVTDNATDDGTLWIVSATDGITSAFNPGRKLQYNSASNGQRFCCYTGTQKDVVLYKEIATTTGIIHHPTSITHHPTSVYDISGRLLKGVSFDQLPKGVYICGGKKYVVK